MRGLKSVISLLLLYVLCLVSFEVYTAGAQGEKSLSQEREGDYPLSLEEEKREQASLSLGECIDFAAYNSFEVKLGSNIRYYFLRRYRILKR